MELELNDRTTPDLNDLVSRAQHGSHDAFAELVRLYQDDVRTFVCWRLCDRSIADDVSQDVFVQAFRKIGNFRGEGSFRAWLLGIAKHQVMNQLRQRKRRYATSLDDTLDHLRLTSDQDNPEDAELRLEQLRVLQDCISQLPKERQNVLNQFYSNSVPVAVIGRQIERKPGAVRMLLFRIRDVLRQCIEQKTDDGA